MSRLKTVIQGISIKESYLNGQLTKVTYECVRLLYSNLINHDALTKGICKHRLCNNCLLDNDHTTRLSTLINVRNINE